MIEVKDVGMAHGRYLIHSVFVNKIGGAEMTLKVRQLEVGERAMVTGFAGGGHGYRKKLQAMGMVPGAEFSITRLAPLGDPVEIRVRGTSLSLRKAEADALDIRRAN